MSASAKLTALDFEAVSVRRLAPRLETTQLSNWQQVWRRFRAHRPALVSLFIALFIVSFGLVGPILWSVDPTQQNLGQISQPPSLARKAILVDTREQWAGISVQSSAQRLLPAKQLSIPEGLRVLEANTERIRLVWHSVKGAKSYRIYRHTAPPRDHQDLGLPLGETDHPQIVSFEDRLKLQVRDYYYSVVGSDGGDESALFASIKVRPQQGVSLLEAKLSGLIVSDHNQGVAQFVILPAHPLGTDYLGRDTLARLMHGSRTSLFIGIVAPLLFIGFGSLYGAISAYVGGALDEWMMRLADFVIALPFLLFMILFKVILGLGPGESGVMPMILALVLLSWPATARLVRAQVLLLREQAYVQAAKLLGSNGIYVIWRHVFPNILGIIMVSFSFAVPSAIFTEAFLSFIGMGVVPPTPSWGAMCNDGIRTLFSYPYEMMFPALMISLTVLAFNLLGDGLRDALDAKLRSPT